MAELAGLVMLVVVVTIIARVIGVKTLVAFLMLPWESHYWSHMVRRLQVLAEIDSVLRRICADPKSIHSRTSGNNDT